jgi:hypothetical protein
VPPTSAPQITEICVTFFGFAEQTINELPAIREYETISIPVCNGVEERSRELYNFKLKTSSLNRWKIFQL